MKRIIVTATCVFLLFQINAQIFVSPNGNGNGSSWNDAADLQTALAQASYGDQLWLSSGTYLPTNDADRNASFNIPDGVSVYGGFAGHESDIYDRNIEANSTTLSGDIGIQGEHSDNSYTVVLFQGVSEQTLIDGLTIANGFSDGRGDKGDLARCGGGIFNDGSNSQSNPTIENCLFKSNFARDGAAIYNYAAHGSVSAYIANCSFLFNKADFDGGAIHNDGNNGSCNVTIRNSKFYNNEASYGAGISNECENGEAKPLIASCDFSNNTSYIEGSSVYNYSATCQPIIKDCSYSNNVQSIGADVSSKDALISQHHNKQTSQKPDLRFSAGGK